MLTALFVVARIVANPISNVFQKQLARRAAHPVFIIGATHALLTLAALPWPFVQFLRERGIQLRFAALAFSATEAVFLKRAVLHSSPVITFLFWSILGLPVAAVAIVLLLRRSVGEEMLRLRRHWRTYLWLAITTGLMQLATLLTFGTLQVGYSLALFQLSTLISVFLGYRYFHERNIRRRLVGSAVMVAGAVLIVALGRRS